MRALYLDLSSGISGDMFTAALLDLGANATKLRAVLDSLQLDGFDIAISKVQRSALSMCDFKVNLAVDNHDADMNFLFGTGSSATPATAAHTLASALQSGLFHPAHEHSNAHEHAHHHHHAHRSLSDIEAIIDRSSATPRAKALAQEIFHILGEAEASAHGLPLEKVHFHEVGALDSIVDILSAAVCVDDLNIDAVFSSPLTEGHGMVNCAHGSLPIPVPAVSKIAARYHLPLTFSEIAGELVTPTGAAIVAALKPCFNLPPTQWQIKASGFGAGKRAYSRPSFVRALLLEQSSPASADDFHDDIVKLECNIDDMSGELFGYLMEQLQQVGARDVSFIPIYMKKNRPAYLLTVIAKESDLNKLAALIFTHSTTIGIRYVPMKRLILKREATDFASSLGSVQVKRCTLPQTLGGESFVYPEYDSLKALAQAQHLPLKTVDAVVRGELFKERT